MIEFRNCHRERCISSAKMTTTSARHLAALLALAISFLFSAPAYAVQSTGAQGYSLLPTSAAPEEIKRIERSLPTVSECSSEYYSWNLAIFDTRLTVLGTAGKKPKVAGADFSASVAPIVLVPPNGKLKFEIHVHYFSDRNDAKPAYQKQANELSLAVARDRGVTDEYITELRSMDFKPGTAKKAPLGATLEYTRLRYESMLSDLPAGSFIQSGEGSILAVVVGAKSGAYTVRIDFKAESAPDVRAIVAAMAGVVFSAGFGSVPDEYELPESRIADKDE
jgi:hypothetical protein